ncbi:hypothetical protein CC80DRAFT_588228 [Byssothecium circinans]|uniref:Uncharacterized protein n=1 Tax=Byssothecium circinans TaxID=147558 RepID=A0A6A5UCR9_9PLEO|nr:hypothetical protein CC80DRAFT_588228 [Byssothecium circinans]
MHHLAFLLLIFFFSTNTPAYARPAYAAFPRLALRMSPNPYVAAADVVFHESGYKRGHERERERERKCERERERERPLARVPPPSPPPSLLPSPSPPSQHMHMHMDVSSRGDAGKKCRADDGTTPCSGDKGEGSEQVQNEEGGKGAGSREEEEGEIEYCWTTLRVDEGFSSAGYRYGFPKGICYDFQRGEWVVEDVQKNLRSIEVDPGCKCWVAYDWGQGQHNGGCKVEGGAVKLDEVVGRKDLGGLRVGSMECLG